MVYEANKIKKKKRKNKKKYNKKIKIHEKNTKMYIQ